jgi:hypothetical protein
MIINEVPTKLQIHGTGAGKLLPIAKKYLIKLISDMESIGVTIMDRRYIVPLSSGTVNIYIQSTPWYNLIRLDSTNPYPLLILLYTVNTSSQGQEHTLSFNHTDGGDYRLVMYDFIDSNGDFNSTLKSYTFKYSEFKNLALLIMALILLFK